MTFFPANVRPDSTIMVRDLAGKVILPSRKLALAPTLQAQPDVTNALPLTNLRERLTSLSITQSQFAQLCRVHPNTVSNWARGRSRMNHAAELVLQVLESDQRSAQYVASRRGKGRPRGKPFVPGNPYRFGDRRRKYHVAGAQIARAATTQ